MFKKLVLNLFLILIRIYKLILSPILPPSCRFYPTCSAYAVESLKEHGIVRGTVLTLKRVFRCHPFCPGGYDPVEKKLPNHNLTG